MTTMSTITDRSGAELRYNVHGAGTPVLNLHGAYSTHEEIAAILEPLFDSGAGYRRLYPDLPGMGETPGHTSVHSVNDVVDLLDRLVSAEIGSEPFLVIGHSFGAHLARGIAARHPDQVAGLALICPMVAPNTAEAHPSSHIADEPSELIDPDHLDDYNGYFVVRTDATAVRFNEAVVPSLGRFESEAVAALMSDTMLRPDPDHVVCSAPTLVLTGRHDSFRRLPRPTGPDRHLPQRHPRCTCSRRTCVATRTPDADEPDTPRLAQSNRHRPPRVRP